MRWPRNKALRIAAQFAYATSPLWAFYGLFFLLIALANGRPR